MTNPVIDKDGTKKWFNSNGKLHREDGPAIEYQNGSKFWCINGEYNRDDGPACEIILGDIGGYYEWWIKGNPIANEVNQWIEDNNFPQYEEWSDSIKVMFKLTFG